MNECMHGLTVVCVCLCCVCGWVVRSTCLQSGGAVYIANGQGTFTNCNFTSNSAGQVSHEEEQVDGCDMSRCIMLRLCPSMHLFLTDTSLLPLSISCACFLRSAICLDLTYFSALARLFFCFACTSVEGKSFCDLSSHIFS